MSSITATAGPFRYAKEIIWSAIWLGVLGASIWALVFGIMNWQRGIYAGFHYNEAKGFAQEALAKKYGWTLVQQMRLGKPDVINTHSDNLVQGGQQIRVFHIIGPRGVKYCVSVWGGSYATVVSDSTVVKGCKDF